MNSDTVCRGTLTLGSACKRCSRCVSAIRTIVERPTLDLVEMLVKQCYVRWLTIEDYEYRVLMVDSFRVDHDDEIGMIHALYWLEKKGRVVEYEDDSADGPITVYQVVEEDF